MTVLLDHLSAIIIGAAVIMILAATQIFAQRSGIEQAASYATKTKALSFGEWIEDDILTLGENFGRNRFRFEVPEVDTLGNTTKFQFYSDSLNIMTGDTLRMMTRYQLQYVDSIQRDTIITPVYRLRRQIAQSPVTNGTAPEPSTWTTDGFSLSTLSSFRIIMLDRTGAETGSVEEGDFLRISFNLLPQFPVEPEYLRELYWSTTLKVRPFWNPPA